MEVALLSGSREVAQRLAALHARASLVSDDGPAADAHTAPKILYLSHRQQSETPFGHPGRYPRGDAPVAAGRRRPMVVSAILSTDLAKPH